MAHPTSLRAFRPLKFSICASCRSKALFQSPSSLRPFGSTAHAPAKESIDVDDVMRRIDNSFQRTPGTYENMIPPTGQVNPLLYQNLQRREWEEEPRHHLHIYATKHNTHITLTKPNRNALISVSCGNIGFRKAGRGTYDAAYQLAAFVMSRIQDKGLLVDIQKMEVIYRGFGPGREAVTKAILGSEGRKIRDKIIRLSDATRLKFGGTRSPAPRRLG
ncbi:translational machinery component [Lindgomyces ingoldianus]|uniref:Translational machinery component n=1 Tax=Lindgomyces ingoldianus TaxID=673940 RepID=A0ACB6QXZ8_9PLEO|nr:translational machinery component [Lindgomyces ingoldianus]KAF2471909.1 translational machinery component [Lindgomyces ingoldianus]